MENHSSHAKLVNLESGLILPPKSKGSHFITSPRCKLSSNKCSNYLFIYMVTALLLVGVFQIWQTVREEKLIQKIGGRDAASIRNMVEELGKVKNTLEEIREEIRPQDQKTTTELPVTTSSYSNVDESTQDLKQDWVWQILANDSMPPFNSRSIISASTSETPRLMINERKEKQILDNLERLLQASGIKPNDESVGSWRAYLHPNSGEQSTGDKIIEELSDTKSEDLEEATSTEAVSEWLLKDSPWFQHRQYTTPFRKSYEWHFRWGSPNTEDPENPEIVENVEEKVDSLETVKTPELTTQEDWFTPWFVTPWTDSTKNDDYQKLVTGSTEESDSLDDTELRNPTTESSLVLTTSNEDRSESTSTERTLEESANQGDSLLDDERDSDFWKRAEYNDEYTDGSISERNPESHQDLRWIEPRGAADEYSYISKRSIDDSESVPILERPRGSLEGKELQGMSAILPATLDENYILYNERSSISEPTMDVLVSNADDFDTKMETVAAHIEQLNEQYLRTRELEDDYVSKEFPPAADGEVSLSPDN